MSSALVVMSGAVGYLATLILVPLLDPTRDPLRTHPEDYAAGGAGLLVNIGYLALAVALIPLAATAFRLPVVAARLAAACFAAAALTCLANGLDPTLATRGSPVELGVFGLVLGPPILSAVLRRRELAIVAALVVIAFVALLASPAAVGGLVNRAFDATAALWCILLARRWPARAAG